MRRCAPKYLLQSPPRRTSRGRPPRPRSPPGGGAQSPGGGVGRVLTAFASGLEVSVQELLDDVEAARRHVGYHTGAMVLPDRAALDCLERFVRHHGAMIAGQHRQFFRRRQTQPTPCCRLNTRSPRSTIEVGLSPSAVAARRCLRGEETVRTVCGVTARRTQWRRRNSDAITAVSDGLDRHFSVAAASG